MTKDTIVRFHREVRLSSTIVPTSLAAQRLTHRLLSRVIRTGCRCIANPNHGVQLPQGDRGDRSRL